MIDKFKNGDRVQFHSTSDVELDSITGTVIGIYDRNHAGAGYIVRMDVRHSAWPWDATVMTEHCMKGI
jgi:hypothetical protein